MRIFQNCMTARLVLMLKITIGSWLFIFKVAAAMPNANSDQVCIFPFVPDSEVYLTPLKKMVQSNNKIKWFKDPSIKDISYLNESVSGCTEIIFIFHMFKSQLDTFSYTRRMTDLEKAEIEHQHGKLDCTNCYIPLRPIYDRPFKKLFESLRARQNDPFFNPLRRIKFVACDAERVALKYASIQKLRAELHVNLAFSGTAELLSILKGTKVSTPITEEILESFQYYDQNNLYFYSYLPIYTTGIGAFGKAHVLRGKYKIEFKSLSFGLGRIFTKVFIPFKEVANLEIGKSINLLTPRIGLSLAFSLLKLSSDLAPKPFFLVANELDSFGVEMDFLAFVKITRIY